MWKEASKSQASFVTCKAKIYFKKILHIQVLINVRSLKNHYEDDHEDRKGYPCPHGCPKKTLKSEAFLRYHLKCYHSGVQRRYECPECPLVFAKAHREVKRD